MTRSQLTSGPAENLRCGFRESTHVALGMAGPVQVERVHVHESHDTIEVDQSRSGTGFQHLGIYSRNREDAQTFLESLGAALDDHGEHAGVRFAFMDVPTGPGMFELLEATGGSTPPGAVDPDAQAPVAATDSIALNRATIATANLDPALGFFARAFGWNDVAAGTHTLRCGSSKSQVRRARKRAGKLLIELVEPQAGADDPYSIQQPAISQSIPSGPPTEVRGRKKSPREGSGPFAANCWAKGS